MRHFCAHILVLVLVLASLSVSWGATTKAEETFVPITTETPTDEPTVADTESPITSPENPSDGLPVVNTTETEPPTPPAIAAVVVVVAPPEEETAPPTPNVTTNATSNTTNTTDDEDSGAFSSMSGGRVVAVAVGLMTAVVVTVF